MVFEQAWLNVSEWKVNATRNHSVDLQPGIELKLELEPGIE